MSKKGVFDVHSLFTVILAIGVRESALFTKIFTGMNLCVLSYIVIAGAFQDKSDNWNIPASQVNADTVDGQCGVGQTCGNGGFNPYGVKGIMKGAATCFYAFVGFDSIATTGNEETSTDFLRLIERRFDIQAKKPGILKEPFLLQRLHHLLLSSCFTPVLALLLQ